MTIPVSTVPAAQTYLLKAIQAQITPSTTMVCVGTPPADLPTFIIQIGTGISRTVKRMATVGDGGQWFLEESYTIGIQISVAMETVATTVTTGPTAVSQKAWELVAYVETAIRTTPSLGGLVLEARPGRSTGGKVEWGAGATPGRVCTITVPMHVEATI